jgi:hypothetical protein
MSGQKREREAARRRVIDLDDTDGDTDDEELGADGYVADGFLVFDDGEIPLSDARRLATCKNAEAIEDEDESGGGGAEGLGAIADRMWGSMLETQIGRWKAYGSDRRTKKELEIKLTQFRTPAGQAMASELASRHGLFHAPATLK